MSIGEPPTYYHNGVKEIKGQPHYDNQYTVSTRQGLSYRNHKYNVTIQLLLFNAQLAAAELISLF